MVVIVCKKYFTWFCLPPARLDNGDHDNEYGGGGGYQSQARRALSSPSFVFCQPGLMVLIMIMKMVVVITVNLSEPKISPSFVLCQPL